MANARVDKVTLRCEDTGTTTYHTTMAKASKVITPSVNTESVTLSQQGVNVARQIVNAIGWAKTVEDIAIGGELLVRVFPTLDPIDDWIKTDAEVKKMTPTEAKTYLEKDRAWGTKPCAFTMTDKQKAVVVKAFKHFVEESANAGKLGPSEWLTELIGVFGIADDGDKVSE